MEITSAEFVVSNSRADMMSEDASAGIRFYRTVECG